MGKSKKRKLSSVVYIDQSGKIEFTSQDTVVAFSNGETKTLLIKAADKRLVQSYFRAAGKPDIFVYKTFSVLIFFLVENDLAKISRLVIDIEYPGKNDLIKNFLTGMFRKHGIDPGRIEIAFALVGRKRNCHIQGLTVHRGHVNPDATMKVKDILKWVV